MTDTLDDYRQDALLRLQDKIAKLQDKVQTLTAIVEAMQGEVAELPGIVSAVVDAATVKVAYNGMKIDELQKHEEA